VTAPFGEPPLTAGGWQIVESGPEKCSWVARSAGVGGEVLDDLGGGECVECLIDEWLKSVEVTSAEVGPGGHQCGQHVIEIWMMCLGWFSWLWLFSPLHLLRRRAARSVDAHGVGGG